MQTSIGLGIGFFGIYLITILCALRIVKEKSPAVLVCGSAILIYIFGLMVIYCMGWAINFFSFSSTFWFLSISVLMIFGAVYKSISLRMMLHLLNQPAKTDTYDAILENYIKNQSYTNRVDILLEKNMIQKEDETLYCLTNKGKFFASLLGGIQQTFSIKESG